MEIRGAMPGDEAEVEQVVSAAFGEAPDGRVVQMMRALRTGGAARASVVAVVDEELVAHVGLSRGWVDARRELVEVMVLSPLSVRPDRQRRGIGTALVAAALEVAGDRGAPAVFLEGSPDYYGRRGSASPPPSASSGPRRASRTRGSRWRCCRRTSRGSPAG